MQIKSLMETNVYSVRGKVLIVGACLRSVWPEAFETLAARADQVYSLCLENSHINMAVTKLTAVLGTGQVELPRHVPMEHFVCTEEGAIPVTAEAVELSKSLAKLTKLAKEAEA